MVKLLKTHTRGIRNATAAFENKLALAPIRQQKGRRGTHPDGQVEQLQFVKNE